MKITVVQTSPKFLMVDENRKDLVHHLGNSKGDLIIFPELCTSGYNFKSKTEVRRCSESVPQGKTSRILSSFAKKKNCAIVLGLPEVHKGKFFNSAIFVTPSSLHVYRKIHLFWNEKKFFSPGTSGFRVFNWKSARIGLMICFDWFFPEAARTLAIKGADIIAHPSNLVLPFAQDGMKIRSLENNVYSATANRVGRERGLKFTGQSQILDTKGTVLGRLSAKGSGILTVSITPGRARKKKITPENNIFQDRKTKFYA